MTTHLNLFSCTMVIERWQDFENMFRNDIICGGIDTSIEYPASCYYLHRNGYFELEQRCRHSAAVAACLGLTVMLLVGTGALVYARMKRDGRLEKQEWWR
jgi:hypothetical protein